MKKDCKVHIGQSMLSHHKKILCDSGIVKSYKEGKWTYYAINEEGAERAKQLLVQVTSVYGHPKARLERCK